jgi:4-hydroxythreonine-4-phosphate dehydrogenase
VKKVDSLLRGNLSREIASLADELGRTPVVAVANPALRRTVRGGILHIGETPLHATDLWRVEATAPPPSVVHALAPLRAVVVPQSVVAAGVGAVASALSELARAGAVAVCDSVTEHDLSTIHSATLALSHETLLVGSGALVDVAVRALAPESGLARESGLPRRPGGHSGPPTPRVRSLLMVLGTRAPSAQVQLARVAERADHVEVIAPADLLTNPADVAAHLAEVVSTSPEARLVVLTIDPAADIDGTMSSRLVAALADAAAHVAHHFDGVFLSGGETARAVLDRLGTQTLRVVGELGTGTVVSHRDGGAVVVTRPGSFGGPDSLLHVAERLLDSRGTHRSADVTPSSADVTPSSADAVPGSSDTAMPGSIATITPAALTTHAPPHVTPKEIP